MFKLGGKGVGVDESAPTSQDKIHSFRDVGYFRNRS
jgi:hypothetical protein